MAADSGARPRLRELDSLRGIAALGVVIYHYTKFIAENFGVARPAWMNAKAFAWLYPFHVGSHGVALFFVISGFVIFMTLERTKRGLDFVKSRFSRLYPAFWCGVLVTTLFKVSLGGEDFSAAAALANLTMFAEPLGYPYTDGVYWTLFVEMKFYLFMLAFWWLGVLRRVELVCLAWFAALVAYRVALKLGVDPTLAEPIADLLILKYIPLFAAGMMFYCIHKHRVSARYLFVIALALLATWSSGNIEKALVVTATFAAMALLCAGRLSLLGRSALLRWLGDRSYTLYLVHGTIGFIVLGKLVRFTHSGWILFGATAALSVLLAHAMHHVVEKPALSALRGSRRPELREATIN